MADGRGIARPACKHRLQVRSEGVANLELRQRRPSVGWDMLRHVVRQERDAGRLEATGRGRGARWRRIASGAGDGNAGKRGERG